MAERRLRLAPQPMPTILLFDQRCVFEQRSGTKRWTGRAHNGSVRLPDGHRIPISVTSFAGETAGRPFFVMALPPIWDKAGIPISGDHLALTGVFLHEFSHTRQTPALAPVFAAAAAVRAMPEDFSDDSLQEHFRSDAAYSAAAVKETELLFAAAVDPNADRARSLAQKALEMMEERQAKWFVGENADWKPYDDLFLTMEGFGQWVGYAWLTDPRGGRLSRETARDKMRGTRKWWSQEEGLALFLVIDRFVPGWQQRAFAVRPALGIDLLRLAVRNPEQR